LTRSYNQINAGRDVTDADHVVGTNAAAVHVVNGIGITTSSPAADAGSEVVRTPIRS